MILHVIHDFSARGGAEMMLARIISQTAEPALLVSLMAISDDNLSLIKHPDVRTIALGMRSVRQLPRIVAALRGIIRREQPAGILCWLYNAGAPTALAGRLAGYRGRIVLTVRGALDDYATATPTAKLAIQANRLFMSLLGGVIFNSRRAVENHSRVGFRPHDAVVIHNGISLPSTPSQPQNQSPVIGIAARLDIDKDYDTFFAAAALVAARHAAVRFVVAGRNMTWDNPQVVAMIEQSNLPRNRVTLFGELRDMRPFYESLDLCVLSSRTEGFPNAVLEAMSYGIPCVATDVGDIRELVGDTGEVVAPQSPRALADGIERLLAMDETSFSAMARAARERVERQFDIGKVTQLYQAFVLGT